MGSAHKEIEMEAGRYLDARIAEEVMGYERIPSRKPYGFGNAWLPHYSTRIQDAWLVVEKFDKKTFMMGRHRLSGNLRWVVDIFTGNKTGPYRGIADTAPLAICLAALRAIE